MRANLGRFNFFEVRSDAAGGEEGLGRKEVGKSLRTRLWIKNSRSMYIRQTQMIDGRGLQKTHEFFF